jgi:HlyD family secretion protein
VSRQAFDHQRTELSISQGEVAKAKEDLQILEIGPRSERIAAQRAALAQATATSSASSACSRRPSSPRRSRARSPLGIASRVKRVAGRPSSTIRNFDDRWVRVYIPGDEVGSLTLGQAASISGRREPPSKRYTGAISYIASVAEFTPRNVQSTKDRVKLVYEVAFALPATRTSISSPVFPRTCGSRCRRASSPLRT